MVFCGRRKIGREGKRKEGRKEGKEEGRKKRRKEGRRLDEMTLPIAEDAEIASS